MSKVKFNARVSDGLSRTVASDEAVKYKTHCGKEKDLYHQTAERHNRDNQEFVTGARNGRPNTQHGVSAEYHTAAERNAKEFRDAAREGRRPVMTVKSPETNGPDDLVKDFGIDQYGNHKVEVYQCKYYKTTNESLGGCIGHMKKYPDRYKDNPDAKYIIPKDQYEQIVIVKKGGTPPGMSEKDVAKLKRGIEKYEQEKGASIEASLQPGGVTYEESQLENIQEVCDSRSEQLQKEHQESLERLKKENAFSMKKGLKVAAIAGTAAGVCTAGSIVYNKAKEGKNLFAGDYDKEDYYELGLETAKSAGVAGLMGFAAYYVEKAFERNAGKIKGGASYAIMIFPLCVSFVNEEITAQEFMDKLCHLFAKELVNRVCGVAAGAAIGWGLSLLGVSVVGGPVGVSAALCVLGVIAGGYLADKSIELMDYYFNEDIREKKEKFNALMNKLNAELENKLNEIEAKYERAHQCLNDAWNESLDMSERLEAINGLSEHYGGRRIDTNFDPDEFEKLLFA